MPQFILRYKYTKNSSLKNFIVNQCAMSSSLAYKTVWYLHTFDDTSDKDVINSLRIFIEKELPYRAENKEHEESHNLTSSVQKYIDNVKHANIINTQTYENCVLQYIVCKQVAKQFSNLFDNM